jgi:hypothetical protein
VTVEGAAVSRRQSFPGFSWNLIGGQTRAGRVNRGDTDVVVKRRRAQRRLIPNIDARAARNARRELNWWIADHHVAAHSRIRRRREHDDPVGVAVGGVLFDEIIVASDDPDPEIVVRSREAVSSRLVPPERVIAADDSYAATARGCVAVPDGNVRSQSDSRGGGIHAYARHAVRRYGYTFDFAQQRAGEEDSVRAKPLYDAWSPHLDIALAIRADAHLASRCRAIAPGSRVGLSGHSETVEAQIDMGTSEENARRAGDHACDIADEATVFADRSCGCNEAADVVSGGDTDRQQKRRTDEPRPRPESTYPHDRSPCASYKSFAPEPYTPVLVRRPIFFQESSKIWDLI